MQDVQKTITQRRSVRTFDETPLSNDDKQKIMEFAQQATNPYNVPIEFKYLDAKEHGLSCPVVKGTDLYVGGKIKKGQFANEAFGFSFEKIVLFAQSLGVGTVWLGGTFNRIAYEKAMQLDQDQIMPCASPLGYVAEKMSLRESMMRKVVKADKRKDFADLFFDHTFDTPLTKEKAGQLAFALEMVRLAPSTVNKQPWRVVVAKNAVHFYLKRSFNFAGGDLDMQKIDMGIALCHFETAAKSQGLNVSFALQDPNLATDQNLLYIASYLLG